MKLKLKTLLSILVAAVISVATSTLAFAQHDEPAGHEAQKNAHEATGHEATKNDGTGHHGAGHETAGHEAGGHHGPAPINWTDISDKTRPAFIALALNFGILVAIYYALGKKGVVEGLKKRRIDIGKDIDDAREMLEAAKERAKKYQADLKNADVDAATAKASIVSTGKGEVEHVLTEANEKAERMKRDAERLVEQEGKQLRQDLTVEAIDRAMISAQKILETKAPSFARGRRIGAPRGARSHAGRQARWSRHAECSSAHRRCFVIPGVIARRYATALLEIGVESGRLDALVDEIKNAAEAYDNSAELRSAFADPLVPIQAKQAILSDLGQRLNFGPTTKNVLTMLLDRRRIQAIVPISQRLKEIADAQRGVLRAEVHTAMPLPEEYFTQLQQQLERVTGRRIALDRKLDPSLICGVVARVGDTIYDGSLLSRLRSIKDSMLPN